MVEVLRERYRIPFLAQPPLSKDQISFVSYAPSSIKGAALEKELLELSNKGAVETKFITLSGLGVNT